MPARAPRPAYQKQYTGDRYPQPEQQYKVYGQKYRYQPRDKAVRQHFKQVNPQMKNQPQQAPPASRENRPQPGAQQGANSRGTRHQGQDKDDNPGKGHDK